MNEQKLMSDLEYLRKEVKRLDFNHSASKKDFKIELDKLTRRIEKLEENFRKLANWFQRFADLNKNKVEIIE